MTKDSLHHAAKNGEHSCVEIFHGDNLNKHNVNKLSCTHQSLQETQHLCHPEHCLTFVGPEHQSSKIYHAFRNYVKTTFNNGLSLSEVDLSHLKRETTNHGSNLMEVDWGGNIDSNYTSTTKHGPSLMEVDWGGNIDPNYTSSGCMLMQVDWGGKLRVNHINECMPSEVDWGAHETHQNGHSITRVDWGDYDPTLYPMDGSILSEVDWGAHDSSLFLYLVHIDHDAKAKEFFTQGLLTEFLQPLQVQSHLEMSGILVQLGHIQRT